jgi:hypothetical protein
MPVGIKTDSPPKSLTERRFRQYWERTGKASKDSIRFRAVLTLIESVLFGRFLTFITTVINSDSVPKSLTEGRFRKYWERTEGSVYPRG